MSRAWEENQPSGCLPSSWNAQHVRLAVVRWKEGKLSKRGKASCLEKLWVLLPLYPASVGAPQHICVLDIAPIPGLTGKEDKIEHVKH